MAPHVNTALLLTQDKFLVGFLRIRTIRETKTPRRNRRNPRALPESDGLLAEWMTGEEGDAAPERAERSERHDLIATGGLAERLASPVAGMASVAEAGQ